MARDAETAKVILDQYGRVAAFVADQQTVLASSSAAAASGMAASSQAASSSAAASTQAATAAATLGGEWARVSVVATNLTAAELQTLDAVGRLTNAVAFEGAGQGVLATQIANVVPALEQESVATLAAANALQGMGRAATAGLGSLQQFAPVLEGDAVATLAVATAFEGIGRAAIAGSGSIRTLGEAFAEINVAEALAAEESIRFVEATQKIQIVIPTFSEGTVAAESFSVAMRAVGNNVTAGLGSLQQFAPALELNSVATLAVANAFEGMGRAAIAGSGSIRTLGAVLAEIDVAEARAAQESIRFVEAVRLIRTVVPTFSEATLAVESLSTAMQTIGVGAQRSVAAVEGLTAGLRVLGAAALTAKNESSFLAGALDSIGSIAILAAGPLSGIGSRLVALIAIQRALSSSLGGELATAAALGFGAIALLSTGLGAAFKSATAFQTAMTGVAKTTDLSDANIQRLGNSFLRISGQIGVSAEELGKIAASAGQLGIRGVENLELFTTTVAKLTKTTNLTAEEATIALGKLLFVTHGAVGDVDRLAAVIVDLGNNSAATESQIVHAGTEVAKVGGIFGFSAQQSLGFGAAMASLGVRAESGATGVGRLAQTFDLLAREGGPKLQKLAEIVGTSTAEMASLIRTNAAEAIRLFINGLSNLEAHGGSAAAALHEFGLTGIRESKAILPMVNNVQLLNSELARAAQEFENPTAAEREFARFSDTLARSLARLKETITNIGIASTQDALPGITHFLDSLRIGIGDISTFAGVIDSLLAGFAGFALVGGITLLLSAFGIALGGLPAIIVGVGIALVIGADHLLRYASGLNEAQAAAQKAEAGFKTVGLGIRDANKAIEEATKAGINQDLIDKVVKYRDELVLLTAQNLNTKGASSDLAQAVGNLRTQIKQTQEQADQKALLDDKKITTAKDKILELIDSLNNYNQQRATSASFTDQGLVSAREIDGLNEARKILHGLTQENRDYLEGLLKIPGAETSVADAVETLLTRRQAEITTTTRLEQVIAELVTRNKEAQKATQEQEKVTQDVVNARKNLITVNAQAAASDGTLAGAIKSTADQIKAHEALLNALIAARRGDSAEAQREREAIAALRIVEESEKDTEKLIAEEHKKLQKTMTDLGVALEDVRLKWAALGNTVSSQTAFTGRANDSLKVIASTAGKVADEILRLKQRFDELSRTGGAGLPELSRAMDGAKSSAASLTLQFNKFLEQAGHAETVDQATQRVSQLTDMVKLSSVAFGEASNQTVFYKEALSAASVNLQQLTAEQERAKESAKALAAAQLQAAKDAQAAAEQQAAAFSRVAGFGATQFGNAQTQEEALAAVRQFEKDYNDAITQGDAARATELRQSAEDYQRILQGTVSGYARIAAGTPQALLPFGQALGELTRALSPLFTGASNAAISGVGSFTRAVVNSQISLSARNAALNSTVSATNAVTSSTDKATASVSKLNGAIDTAQSGFDSLASTASNAADRVARSWQGASEVIVNAQNQTQQSAGQDLSFNVWARGSPQLPFSDYFEDYIPSVVRRAIANINSASDSRISVPSNVSEAISRTGSAQSSDDQLGDAGTALRRAQRQRDATIAAQTKHLAEIAAQLRDQHRTLNKQLDASKRTAGASESTAKTVGNGVGPVTVRPIETTIRRVTGKTSFRLQ